MLPGVGPVKPCFSASALPAGVCTDANANRPAESCRMMNCTERLQKLQLPSKRMTSRPSIAASYHGAPHYQTAIRLNAAHPGTDDDPWGKCGSPIHEPKSPSDRRRFGNPRACGGAVE